MGFINRVRTHKVLVISMGAYLLLCFIAMQFYGLWTNPDGVSYLSIAEKYSQGDFKNAVNGYWGPLISWLLIPFYLINKNPLIGAKLILITAGLCSLVLSYLLLLSYKVKQWILAIFLLSFVPLLTYWTMAFAITPDSLVLAVFLLYVYVLARNDLKHQPVLLGIIGALGYYAKAYFLVFFVAHTIILYLLKRYKDKDKGMRASLITIGITLVLALPWIALLSLKYETPTFSTTSTFIYKIFNPNNPQGFPTDYVGLIEPPNNTAISIWEDPNYLPIESWNPLSSFSSLKIPFRLILDNINRIGEAFLGLSVFAVAALLGLFVSLLARWRKLKQQELALASAAGIYVLGLSIALVEYRYLLPAFAGLLLWAAYAASYFKFNGFKNYSLNVAVFIIVASIIVSPLLQLYSRRHEQDEAYHQANALRAYIKQGEHVASDDFDSIRYCYFLQAKCYGRIYPANDDAENQRQLEQSDITSVIVRKGSDDWARPPYLVKFEEVARLGDTRLFQRRIY